MSRSEAFKRYDIKTVRTATLLAASAAAGILLSVSDTSPGGPISRQNPEVNLPQHPIETTAQLPSQAEQIPELTTAHIGVAALAELMASGQ